MREHLYVTDLPSQFLTFKKMDSVNPVWIPLIGKEVSKGMLHRFNASTKKLISYLQEELANTYPRATIYLNIGALKDKNAGVIDKTKIPIAVESIDHSYTCKVVDVTTNNIETVEKNFNPAESLSSTTVSPLVSFSDNLVKYTSLLNSRDKKFTLDILEYLNHYEGKQVYLAGQTAQSAWAKRTWLNNRNYVYIDLFAVFEPKDYERFVQHHDVGTKIGEGSMFNRGTVSGRGYSLEKVSDPHYLTILPNTYELLCTPMCVVRRPKSVLIKALTTDEFNELEKSLLS